MPLKKFFYGQIFAHKPSMDLHYPHNKVKIPLPGIQMFSKVVLSPMMISLVLPIIPHPRASTLSPNTHKCAHSYTHTPIPTSTCPPIPTSVHTHTHTHQYTHTHTHTVSSQPRVSLQPHPTPEKFIIHFTDFRLSQAHAWPLP